MSYSTSDDELRRHRSVYVEAVRRAGRIGLGGRLAMEIAHEVYAAAMLAAERPNLARDAVNALIAARPNCSRAWSIAARVAAMTTADDLVETASSSVA